MKRSLILFGVLTFVLSVAITVYAVDNSTWGKIKAALDRPASRLAKTAEDSAISDLLADQDTLVGTVEVWDDAVDLHITYMISEAEWYLLETHLAVAIANERISCGFPAFYITTPDLLDHLRAAFSPGSEIPYDEFFDQVRNAPLLVLDDFGVHTSTPWAREKLDQLLTYRFNSKLPTVIVPIVPLEQINERLQTRLTDPGLSKVCVIEERQPVSLDYAWGPEFELQKSMTFENFDLQRPKLSPEQLVNLEMAYRAALDFAQSPDGWLVLQGENGCGKTHLAAAIVNYQYQAKKQALFIVVPEFLDHLRSTFNPDRKVSYDELFERVKTAPLLVLDDFGEQSATPWAREKLYQVINYRYNARLPTVITTVYTLDEEEIESRIASRLIASRLSNFLNIIAPDYRSSAFSQQKTARRERRSR